MVLERLKDKLTHHHTEKVDPITHDNRGHAVPTNSDGSATAVAGSTAAHTHVPTAGAGGYNMPAAAAAAGVVGPEVVVMPGTSAGVTKPVYIPIESLPPGTLHTVHTHGHHHATGLVNAGDNRAAAGPVGPGGVAPASVAGVPTSHTPDGHPVANPLAGAGYTLGNTPVIGVTDAAAPVLIPGIAMAAPTPAPAAPVPVAHHSPEKTRHIPVPVPIPVPIPHHHHKEAPTTTVVEIHDYSPEQSRHHVPIVPVPVPVPVHSHPRDVDTTTVIVEDHPRETITHTTPAVVPVPVPIPVGDTTRSAEPSAVHIAAAPQSSVYVPTPVGVAVAPVALTTTDVLNAPRATGNEHVSGIPSTVVPVPVPVDHTTVVHEHHHAPLVSETTRSVTTVPVTTTTTTTTHTSGAPVGVTSQSSVYVPTPVGVAVSPVALTATDVLNAPRATGNEHIAGIPRTVDGIPVAVTHHQDHSAGHDVNSLVHERTVHTTTDTTRSLPEHVAGVTVTRNSDVPVPHPVGITPVAIALTTADVLNAPGATGHESISAIPRTGNPVAVTHGQHVAPESLIIEGVARSAPHGDVVTTHTTVIDTTHSTTAHHAGSDAHSTTRDIAVGAVGGAATGAAHHSSAAGHSSSSSSSTQHSTSGDHTHSGTVHAATEGSSSSSHHTTATSSKTHEPIPASKAEVFEGIGAHTSPERGVSGAIKPASAMTPGPVGHDLNSQNTDFTDNQHSIPVGSDLKKIDVPADHGY